VSLPAFAALAAMARYEALLFAAGLGTLRDPLAITFIALGLSAGALALMAPGLNRPLYVTLAVLTFPIGVVVSNLALAAVFYALLPPFRLGLRLLGKDPLTRSLEENRETYWVERPPPRSPESYFRQF
jgi:hypothetical protein